jgi:hypothetical protein
VSRSGSRKEAIGASRADRLGSSGDDPGWSQENGRIWETGQFEVNFLQRMKARSGAAVRQVWPAGGTTLRRASRTIALLPACLGDQGTLSKDSVPKDFNPEMESKK